MGREHRFCAYCGHRRRVYLKRHVSVIDGLLALIAGTLLLVPFADGFDPRGIGLGAVFIGFAEIFVVIRHRVSLQCARCGFDPIVYRRSQDQAAQMVRDHIKRREEDPELLLAERVRPAQWKAIRTQRREKAGEAIDSTQQV